MTKKIADLSFWPGWWFADALQYSANYWRGGLIFMSDLFFFLRPHKYWLAGIGSLHEYPMDSPIPTDLNDCLLPVWQVMFHLREFRWVWEQETVNFDTLTWRVAQNFGTCEPNGGDFLTRSRQLRLGRWNERVENLSWEIIKVSCFTLIWK